MIREKEKPGLKHRIKPEMRFKTALNSNLMLSVQCPYWGWPQTAHLGSGVVDALTLSFLKHFLV